MSNTLLNRSIIISGAQGTGKSTLANDILQIPEAAGIEYRAVQTRKNLPLGVSSHMDILRLAVEDPMEAVEFQMRLVRQRTELFRDSMKEGQLIISDRAVFDSYVYFLLHNSMFATEELRKEALDLSNESIKYYDITLLVNTTNGKIDDDHVRVADPEYSVAVASTLTKVTIRAYEREYGDSLSNLIQICHSSERAAIFGKFTKDGKGYMVLEEPDGMVSRKARVDLIKSAILAINSIHTGDYK